MKRNILTLFAIVMSIMFLTITDNIYVKMSCMMFASYLYFRLLIRFSIRSFTPSTLFSGNVESKIKEWIVEANKEKSFLIDSVENDKEIEKLEEEERDQKKLERFIMFKTVLDAFSERFAKFKTQRAIILLRIYQIVLYAMLTWFFFTFINYQLYQISPNNFKVESPYLFDFFYYTAKSLTFSGTDYFKPYSVFAKSIEMASYINFGVFILIFMASYFFAMRQEKLNYNINLTSDLLQAQNFAIENYVEKNYKTNLRQVVEETSKIKESIEKIKSVFDKIF